MREYDAVPVVVFDVMEYPDTFFGGEILLSRIQYLRVRICPFECVGDVVHVALQPYNHGLVRQSETLHLEGGHTHDERLSGAHLVVNYPPAVEFQHPYRIFLAVIQAGDIKTFQVKEREVLAGAVVVWPYITVELAVVHAGKVLLELRELLVQPVHELLAYLVDLGVGKLDGVGIAHLYVFSVLVLYGFCDVGHGVVQGMFQQVIPVISSFFSFHEVFVGDVRVASFKGYAELVDAFRIADAGLYPEKVFRKLFIYGCGYPPFTQVEVKQLEADGFWCGVLQRFQRPPAFLVIGVFLEMLLYPFRFGDDVPRNETVPYLVFFHHGVVEDTAFKLFKQFPPTDVAQALHIFQIHLPELVQ